MKNTKETNFRHQTCFGWSTTKILAESSLKWVLQPTVANNSRMVMRDCGLACVIDCEWCLLHANKARGVTVENLHEWLVGVKAGGSRRQLRSLASSETAELSLKGMCWKDFSCPIPGCHIHNWSLGKAFKIHKYSDTKRHCVHGGAALTPFSN